MDNTVKVYFFEEVFGKCLNVVSFTTDENSDTDLTEAGLVLDVPYLGGSFEVQGDAQLKPDGVHVSAVMVHE